MPRRCLRPLVPALLLGVLLPPAPRSAGAAPLTTERFQARPPPLELHWELLRLPERVVQLAVTPLEPAFRLVEKYRLDRRLYDLISNDERTAFLLPYLFVSGTDGVGGGVMLIHNDLLGDNERVRLSGVLRGNLDFKVKAGFELKLAPLNGRRLGAKVSYETDRDRRYFGTGGDAPEENERALRADELEATLGIELFGPEVLYLTSELWLAYHRERLATGDHPDLPGLEAGDPTVKPPTGFGRTLDVPEARLLLRLDTRDSLGRTSRGFLSQVELSMMHDANGAATSAFRALLDATLFVEVLPQYRVLVLTAGLGAVTPWQEGEDLPLRSLIALGRDAHLRGYKGARFLDRYAWWASLEYRWPIFEHEYEELGLSAVVFADLGRAGETAHALFGEAPRWSLGFGLHGDSAVSSILRLQVAFSPEGHEITFSVGDVL